ncbi:MAG: P-II family nitrogen regulator, partial [Oscillospiraceae bacterium]|nr:P-II family nitrogen regulator [Oscillospiraceae bacterium]
MELYYLMTITERDRSQMVADIYENAGTKLVITKLAQGTATDSHLSVYGLDATDKAIITTIANATETAQIFKAAKRKLFIDIPGNGIMMTVPLKSVAGGKTLAYLTDCEKSGGVPEMNFEHELIVVIMNEGHSDYVMDAAREAGAGGGTVLHAKGTAGHRAEHF